MRYGYCRCSTSEKRQNITRQIHYMSDLGIMPENIFSEFANYYKDKNKLYRLLDVMQFEDELCISEFDRLTRNVEEAVGLLKIFVKKHIKLNISNEVIIEFKENMNPIWIKLYYELAISAEFDRNCISFRVKLGVSDAQKSGKKSGRRKTTISDIPELFIQHYQEYKEGKLNKCEYARVTGLSRISIYKYIGIMEEYESSCKQD